jgi:hypothetical protein
VPIANSYSRKADIKTDIGGCGPKSLAPEFALGFAVGLAPGLATGGIPKLSSWYFTIFAFGERYPKQWNIGKQNRNAWPFYPKRFVGGEWVEPFQAIAAYQNLFQMFVPKALSRKKTKYQIPMGMTFSFSAPQWIRPKSRAFG